MGPGRSLEKLCDRYRNGIEGESLEPPTKRMTTLREWSVAHNWVERAQEYESALNASKSAEVKRLRTEGLAADFERIKELDNIYQALSREFAGGTGLWYWDIKMSAKGDT